MNELVLACCVGIGIVAGLRSMTPPAIVSWAAYLGYLNVAQGPFWFIGSLPLASFLFAWAVFEIGIDKSTFIGNRTGLVGVIFRTVTSAFSAAVLSSSAGMGVGLGIIAGLLGGAIGTYGGYYLRRACVNKTSFGDLWIGIAEDLLAIGLGVTIVSLAVS